MVETAVRTRRQQELQPHERMPWVNAKKFYDGPRVYYLLMTAASMGAVSFEGVAQKTGMQIFSAPFGVFTLGFAGKIFWDNRKRREKAFNEAFAENKDQLEQVSELFKIMTSDQIQQFGIRQKALEHSANLVFLATRLKKDKVIINGFKLIGSSYEGDIRVATANWQIPERDSLHGIIRDALRIAQA